MIGGRQPAFWIGLGVTLILGIIQTLLGEGVVSDVLAGRVTDFVNAIAQLLVLLAPLIAGLLIRDQVTPVASPSLPAGTPVLLPDQAAGAKPAGMVTLAAVASKSAAPRR